MLSKVSLLHEVNDFSSTFSLCQKVSLSILGLIIKIHVLLVRNLYELMTSYHITHSPWHYPYFKTLFIFYYKILEGMNYDFMIFSSKYQSSKFLFKCMNFIIYNVILYNFKLLTTIYELQESCNIMYMKWTIYELLS